MRAYCACLGVPHFHWLTFVRNLAVSSITARLRASIEFTVIPKRAQYAPISKSTYGLFGCSVQHYIILFIVRTLRIRKWEIVPRASQITCSLPFETASTVFIHSVVLYHLIMSTEYANILVDSHSCKIKLQGLNWKNSTICRYLDLM